MEKNDRKIIFHLGEETQPIIEGLSKLDDSIFKYQIQQALSIIVPKLENNLPKLENNLPKLENNEIQKESEVFNNIIAFVGERGAGKTSCMYSVIQAIKDYSNISISDNQTYISKEVDAFFKSKKFSYIETIDPSFFDTKHNILEMVIGKMYAHVKELIESNNEDDNDNLRPLLKCFQATKTYLRYITSDTKFEDDTMEELAYLASGMDLKKSIQKMITKYLKFVNKDVLIISLDDIDLNTSQAYAMVEQIRKYLILPNVIILMAIKLDQLSEVIQLEISKHFKNMLDIQQMSFSEINEMTERYIMKLIPLQSRIFLPMPETFFNYPLEIYDEKNTLLKKYDSIKQAVPELIFNKCRYLFYNTRGTTSLIVPRNLRELRLLIRMLYVMPNYIKNSNETLGNKQTFKKYFYGTWLNTLGKESRDVALAILDEDEPVLFNKTVIRKLIELYFSGDKEGDIPEKYRDIINQQNLSFNVSLGDCFYFMDFITNINPNIETKKLIFFIKSVYSIRLYEYYDELTDGLRNNVFSQESKKEDINKDQPYRAEILENISLYEKLIGGNFYLLEGDNLIGTAIQLGSTSRELRLINGRKLLELIRDIVNHEDQINDDEYTKKLQLAEFFMLTVSRYVWTTDTTLNESGMHKYRLNTPAYYDRSFGGTVTNFCFDILAPLFTMLDIRHAYGRFNENIFDIAYKCDNSLIKQLLNNGKDEMHKELFLSKIGLRNAEIIDDVFTYLKRKRSSLKSTDNNEKLLETFYKNLGEYKIASYDYEDKNDYYHITLEAFKIFSGLLSTIDKDLFDSIFVPQIETENMDDFDKEFKDSLGKFKIMHQSTIISRLNKYNSHFINVVGDNTIKELFRSGVSYKTETEIKPKIKKIWLQLTSSKENGKNDNYTDESKTEEKTANITPEPAK